MTSFRETPLAIVGMACRFPGGETLDEFWRLVRDGRSAFTPPAPDRFDRSLHWAPKKGEFSRTDCPLWGQVIQRPVDPRIIEIPEAVAARFDMTHLTLCEVAASACRDAGYEPTRLPYRNTGIYVGNSSVGDLEGDVTYVLHSRQLAERLRRVPQFAALPAELQAMLIAETAAAIRKSCPAGRRSRVRSFASHAAAGLIAGAFGTLGPALVTDSACASSFTSLFLAAQALHLGSVEMAIVAAGACRSWCEVVLMASVQATSSSGSRPFDADADGLIPADGYGAVVLKTLTRAQLDGDRILGVLRGVGMSTDGKGKGFWAPRTEGQVACMRRAQAFADPDRIQYVHAHATSTQLGDVTEVESLDTVFRDSLTGKIPVSSVKGNIGHTLEAAGMAGLIATLLAMKHETIPPAANLRTPNPDIPWNEIPFYAPMKAQPWEKPADGHPRRAAVNSFGIGGINVQVVVDDAPENAVRHFAPGPSALKSSAPSRASNGHESIPGSAPATGGSKSRAERGVEQHCDEVAVIGVGCVLPGAFTVEQFGELLASNRCAMTDVPVERWDPSLPTPITETDERLLPGQGGFLAGYQFDWKKHRIAPLQVANANPLQFLLLDAADQALMDAGYGDGKFDRSRAVALVGTAFTHDFCADSHLGVRLPEFAREFAGVAASHGMTDDSIASMSEAHRAQFIKDKPAVRDDTGSYSSSTLSTRIAKQLDFGGGAMSIDAGDASGLAALGAGIDLLRLGQASLVVCCCGQRNMDLTRFLQLQERKSEMDAVAPPAEGAIAFVLKRGDDARRDGDPIRAVLRPIAAAADPVDVAGAQARTRSGLRSEVCVVTAESGLRARLGNLQGASAMAELLAAIVTMPADSKPGLPTEGASAPPSFAVSSVSNEGFPSLSGGSAWMSVVSPPAAVGRGDAARTEPATSAGSRIAPSTAGAE